MKRLSLFKVFIAQSYQFIILWRAFEIPLGKVSRFANGVFISHHVRSRFAARHF
jgi:hypothetical protein